MGSRFTQTLAVIVFKLIPLWQQPHKQNNMSVQLNISSSSEARTHHRRKSERDMPARPGVQQFSACIWLADKVEHETKEVSGSLVWSHVIGTRINEAIYFLQVGGKYVYLQPYVPVCETLKRNDIKKASIRGFRTDDPTLPTLEVEEKRSHIKQTFSTLSSDDIDSNALSPDKVTVDIQHPCNVIEHTWKSWQLEQNEFLKFVAQLVCRLKVYGEELVALNVCINGTRMQIDPNENKTMRDGGFEPPVQAWVYREQKATLETVIMGEVARALEGEDVDASTDEELSIADSDVEDDKLSLRKSKPPPVEPTKTPAKTPAKTPVKPKPHPKQTKQDIRLYLRLPTEEKVMEVVTKSTTIKQIKSMLCEQEDLDPRTKITMSFEKAKLPDEITVQGAQLENNAILDVAYN